MISVVTNCTAEKLKVAAPARELYRGPSVRRIVKVVDEARGRGVAVGLYIISARHGLVHEWQILEPYDETLTGRSEDDIKRWAVSSGVLENFRRLVETGTVILVASRPYYVAVEEVVCQSDVYVLSPYRACGRWVKTGNFDKHKALAKLLSRLA